MNLSIFRGKVFKNIGLYSLLNLINASIPFLLLPILTQNLSKESYGIIDLFTNLNYIFLPIIGLNIGSSVIRFYYDKEKIDFSKFISSILLFLALFGILIIGMSFLTISFFPIIGRSTGLPNQVIYLSIAFALFSQVCEILLSFWRAEEKPIQFGVFRVSKSLLDLGIAAYLIVFINLDWEARVYTSVLIAGIFSLIAIYILIKELGLNFDFDFSYLKMGLVYSSPLIFHSLGGYIISFSDRFIILHFLGLDEVGLYAVAYQVGMVMSFISNSFNQAWTPFLFSKLKEGNKKTLNQINKINFIYFLVMIILAFIIYLFVPIIYDVFIGEAFAVSPMIIFWVLLGYVFNGMYKMLVNYMFFYKMTKHLAGITIFAAIINIIFCFYLVPSYGIIGAAISTTISFSMMFILVFIVYLNLSKSNNKGLEV